MLKMKTLLYNIGNSNFQSRVLSFNLIRTTDASQLYLSNPIKPRKYANSIIWGDSGLNYSKSQIGNGFGLCPEKVQSYNHITWSK